MSEIVIEQAGTPMVRSEVATKVARKKNKRGERGMTTAEYAVGTVAACGLGGILIKVLTDPKMQELLWKLINTILGQFLGFKAM